LRLEYADGSTEIIAPTIRGARTPDDHVSSIYGGEDQTRASSSAAGIARFRRRQVSRAVSRKTRRLKTLRGASGAAEPLRAIETRMPIAPREVGNATVLPTSARTRPSCRASA